MSEHSPGPWKPATDHQMITDASGLFVCDLADVLPEDKRLITAAPDLLGAAHAVLEVNDSWEPCDIPTCKGCEAMSELRVAVAKAEGR